MNFDLSAILLDEFHSQYDGQKDIQIFDNGSHVDGNNRKYMKMYNWLSFGYDFLEPVAGKLMYGNEIVQMRKQLMSKLEWQDHKSVLCVSIGTGRDLKFIPDNIHFETLDIVGADLSIGMLKKCRKNFKNKSNLSLIQCNAEKLPFVDHSFDIVFHVGGINFFNDKRMAIHEMIRVAKPGCKILIADETQDLIERQYKKNFLFKKYYQDQSFDLSQIENCLPDTVKEKTTELLWNQQFYAITFRM